MNSAKAALFVLVGLGVLLMPPVAVEAQQARKVWRIGFLGMAPATVYAPYVAAFKADLLNFGYVEGRNIAIEYRWAEGKYERLPALASELVRRNMDVILTHGTPATRAAKDATASIPIIMISIADPVASGLVASLARPGGNVTGSAIRRPA
jgi:putative ABC transport system substrate-binding protein